MTAARLAVVDVDRVRKAGATSHIAEGGGRWLLSCYRPRVTPEIVMGFWLFVIVSIGSIPLAGAMARERARSPRAWFWIAVVIGPMAPLALLMLADAKRPASVN